MLALFALLIASSRACENPPPPQLLDRMRTLAPAPNVFLAWIAKSMHSMASAVFPLPDAERNFSPMMLVVQFTPTTPELLSPLAPIVPEQWVPWLLSSSGVQVLLTAL